MSATGKQLKVGNGRYDKDKTRMVGVRFSEEFLDEVIVAAKSKMLTVSAFIRMVVNEKVKDMKSKGDI